jgi:hypothetical protein
VIGQEQFEVRVHHSLLFAFSLKEGGTCSFLFDADQPASAGVRMESWLVGGLSDCIRNSVGPKEERDKGKCGNVESLHLGVIGFLWWLQQPCVCGERRYGHSICFGVASTTTTNGEL